MLHVVWICLATSARFPSNLLIIGVPFFLIFGFNKESPQINRGKGYYLGT